MKVFRKLLTMVIALLVLTQLATATAFAQDPDRGKTLWEEEVWQCAACHGPAGEGLWAGPRAGDENTAQEWIDQVRNPRRNMPAFSADQVSDEQLVDMHAYVTSLPKVDSFAPQDAGLPADAPQGQMLIAEKRCIACHGDTGPLKGFIERGELPTAEGVIKQLRTPFNRMPSYSEAQVSDAEATLIAEFMASQVSEQMAPPTLPESGSGQSATLPVALLLAGAGLVLAAAAVRRFVAPA